MRLYLLMLRRNRRAVLAVGILVGLVAGVGLWSLAAARRTASTFTRYLDAADVSDVSVDFFPVSEDADFGVSDALAIVDRAATIDGVVASSTYIAMESMTLAGITRADSSIGSTSFPEFVGSLDGRFVTQDRVALVSGRLPGSAAPGEVLVNQVLAEGRGLEVGDSLPIDVFDVDTFYTAEPGAPIGRIDAEIIGIGIFPEEVLNDDYDRIARVLLSSAATERWLDVTSYLWQGLRLADPADVPRAVADYRAIAGDDLVVITRETADQVESVQRSVRPVVVALSGFGIAALAAALAVGCLAVGRLARTADDERHVLRAMGVRPRSLTAAASAPGVVAAAIVGVVAIVISLAFSPLAPLGGVRAVEPDRGVDIDPFVAVVGVIVIVAALSTAAVIAAARGGRSAGARAPATTTATATGQLTAALPAAAAIGVRRGLGASSTTGAPVRATIVICSISLATVVAALAFGAGLRRLVDEPQRYGWATDLAMTATGGYDIIDTAEVEGIAAAEGDTVEGVTVSGFASVELGGIDVPSLWASSIRGSLPFTLLSGRLPTSPNEIALGRVSADQIGVGVNDQVEGPRGPLTVVGTVVMPSIGQVTSSHPSLGEGALLTMEGLTALDRSAQPSVLFIDLASDVDAAAVAGHLATRFGVATAEGGLEPFLLLRPAELADADEADATVTALAVVLGLAAVAGLATVIAASVVARRRELAVLRALGCTSADLRRSVRWQAASTAGAAGLIGMPLGLAAGFLMWQAFARTLGVDPRPVVPVVAVGLTFVAAIVLAVLTSLPAARSAARTRVATALQPE